MTRDDALILLIGYINEGRTNGLSAETCRFIYPQVEAIPMYIVMDAVGQDGQPEEPHGAA